MNPPSQPVFASERSDVPPLRLANERRWTIVALLFFASLINYFDRATLSFALPYISTDLHLGPAAKGVLLSAFFWSYALMQIPMGLLADRFNIRWLYAWAFALWSVAQGLTGFASTFSILIGFRIVLGVGEAIYLPGGTRVVSLLFPLSERGLPCGLFDFGTRTGLVLEGLIVPWLITHCGWRTTFVIVGFTALLWLIPWLYVTPAQMRCPRPGPGEAGPNQEGPARSLGSQVLTLLRNRNLLGLCLGFFCFDYYWYLLLTWLPDYMVNVRHLTIQWAGLYTALPFLVFGISQPLGGWIGDRLVRAGWDETKVRKVILSIAFTTGLLIIPAAHAHSANAALGFLMGACLVGLSTANQLVILQGCAPESQVGLWVGIYNFVGNIAGSLAPIITGIIIQTTGSYTPAFVLAGVTIAAGQLAYWFIVGPVKPRPAS